MKIKLIPTLCGTLIGMVLAAPAIARIPGDCECDLWLRELNRCEAGEPTNVRDCRFYYDGWLDCQSNESCQGPQ
ncbi:hypothetical protein [Gallaecimonas xiamenensis]|uniref:Uncharacterized protein n=1 Tax=Gallaecimonas xiamenensis 3-C-1 TaxID=745411 RepID=K2JSM5_9GAMM|nr:hypothetical protein [Gallaecimonas xiamenensis]EKE77507.1 hypothetical protein B3C1_01810 [Gallaecimonas xiamenensis 3-C-1]